MLVTELSEGFMNILLLTPNNGRSSFVSNSDNKIFIISQPLDCPLLSCSKVRVSCCHSALKKFFNIMVHFFHVCIYAGVIAEGKKGGLWSKGAVWLPSSITRMHRSISCHLSVVIPSLQMQVAKKLVQVNFCLEITSLECWGI